MTRPTDDDRRNRNLPRYPDRRAHAFRSPWPQASETVCESCGVTYAGHVVAEHANHDERPDADCAVCAIAQRIAIEQRDTIGTAAAAIEEYLR